MTTHHDKPHPDAKSPLPDQLAALEKAAAGEKPKKEKKKKLGTNRGVETLFRCVYQVHMNLTTLADSKANFLISVNSLIMFIVVVQGMNYVDHKILLIPVAIVLFACAGSIVFAVLSARPRIYKDQTPETSDPSTEPNLLFFGDFTRMPKDQFVNDLKEAMQDSSTVYPLMMSDLHDIGHVLTKKFRLLQYAYGFLLYGLPSGMILFLVLEVLVLKEKL